MNNKILIPFIIFTVMALLPESAVYSNGGAPSEKSETEILSIDLSTPEKTIYMYFEAFRTGNDDLLNKVLVPGARIPEFNVLQILTEPNPALIGVEVNKMREMGERIEHTDSDFYIEPTDIEAYVTFKFDPSIEEVTEGHNMFLLRKFDSEWKIISQVPFWPEDFGKGKEDELNGENVDN